MAKTQDIVAKLWQLCSILREAGITYPEYVTELTYLIFLKMAQETGTDGNLPKGLRWSDLATETGAKQFQFYKKQLKALGAKAKGRVREIFSGAETCLRQPKHLNLLVQEFEQIDWYDAREESALADLYEGLLEKNSSESKAGAGQYFTPRPLIEAVVDVVKPQPGEIIQDPACGTAGFLIAADRYIKNRCGNSANLSKRQIEFQRNEAFQGVELVPQTHKLALMNAMLHNIYGPIVQGDALGKAGEMLAPANVILTNPPFGTKRGAGLPDRKFPVPTSNKQLAFLQHVYLNLKPGGRAAVVMPDLQGGAAPDVISDLMNKCDLHTVLRLPPGIFYAQAVKTNVYFFTRNKTRSEKTKHVWVYDMRSSAPAFGKRTPLTRDYFTEFKKAYGADPYGKSERKEEGGRSRFRCFSRAYIRENGNSLDINWLNDGGGQVHIKTPSPDDLARRIKLKFRFALQELAILTREVKPRR